MAVDQQERNRRISQGLRLSWSRRKGNAMADFRFFVVWQGGNHSGPYLHKDECRTMVRAYKQYGAHIVEARYESIGGSDVRLFDRNGARLT
jgi:hypothetical protein